MKRVAIILAACFACGSPTISLADDTQPLRSQGNQLELPSVGLQPMRPQSIPNQAPANRSTLEIPLPAAYRGCWQGVVSDVDSIEELNQRQHINWVPKSYRICYVQTAGGPFRPTLAESSFLINSEQIRNVKSTLKVITTDGRARATMRGLLQFDEVPVDVLFGLPRERDKAQVDELTNMDCEIDGNVMHVIARLYGQWNGEPWVRIAWHANFVNVPQ